MFRIKRSDRFKNQAELNFQNNQQASPTGAAGSKPVFPAPLKTVKNQVEIFFDGGCRPTNPGNKYGSFEVRLDGRIADRRERVEFGFGTNNEAEFQALLLALDSMEEMITDGKIPSQPTVTCFSDSTILVNRLKGKNRTHKTEPQQRMKRLADQCLGRLNAIGEFEVKWNGRENNVARFGH